MLKLLLEALEHPTPHSVDINDRLVFANTVLWLEDQKIRQYPIDERTQLRQIDDAASWSTAYDQYKHTVGMPEFTTPLEEMTWLLSYAVRLEFLDEPEKYANINAKSIAEETAKSAAPVIKAENLFDNMDFNSKEFIAGVRSLASKLKVPHHPNHLLMLEAVSRIVRERLSAEAKSRSVIEGTPFPFEQGNDIVAKDKMLDYPVRILRLLQIQSLRELQTAINETIVAVQDLTANPKTDTKLGKVGF